MTTSRELKVLLLGAASILVLAAAPAAAQDADSTAAISASDDETIVVTGSRIRRSQGVLPASPLEIIGAQQLEAAAPSSMASFLKDIPANVGPTFASGRGFGDGDRGIGTVNLRGLGAASTLVLLNGQRTTQSPDQADNVVDVNTLVPQIMIDRIEVVKDGASALYGSDAVAGVVNIITNDRFEGLRLDGRIDHFTYSGKGARKLEGMFGASLGDRGHFVVAAGYSDQDGMFIATDVPMMEGWATHPAYASANSNPGTFGVPLRDAAGQLTGVFNSRIDPACGQVTGTFPSTGQLIDGAPVVQDAVDASTRQCRFQFYLDAGAQAASERFQTFAKFDYDLFETVKLAADFGYTVANTKAYYASGAPMSIPDIIIPGHNPGNIYRAVDADGNPLYAVSSGISAGYSRDGAEVFLPLRDTAGQVVLAGNPTDPLSGIPFYEDIRYTGRGVGFQCGLPTGDAANVRDCTKSRPSETDTTLIRGSLGLSGPAFADWAWSAGVNYSRYELATNAGSPGTVLTNQFRRSLEGLGGPNCAGNTPEINGCYYYNLAGNNTFATGPGDPRANSPEVLQYIFALQLDRYISSLLVAEGLLTGTLFEMPAGGLGVALGYQMRRANLTIDYDINKNLRNDGSNATFFDLDESRTTHAFFGEFNAPLIDGGLGYLELNAAVRQETTVGFSTTNPKAGLLYRSPGGRVSLRGTYGTSFVAPSLFRLYSVSGLSGQLNDVCSHPACTGALNNVVQVQTQGNPDLKPERSENFNIGATVEPLDNLRFSVDWWTYKFRDRITTETPQQVLLLDPDGSQTGRVVRGADGQVLQVNVQYFNASRVETSGIDFQANYRQDLDKLGVLNVGLSAGYVPIYRWQLQPGGPETNHAGEVYSNNPGGRQITIASMPKWRGNLNLNWTFGRHNLNAAVRYIGSLILNRDGHVAAVNPDYKVPSWTTVDASYSFSLFDLEEGRTGLKNIKLTIGANNLFDAAVPFAPLPSSQPFIGTLHDVRGRMIWAGATVDF